MDVALDDAVPEKRPYALVYIAGRSYSGSTLLDLLIGTHSASVGLGEVRILSERKRGRAGRRTPMPCTCGAPSRPECGFWQRVFDRTRRDTGRDFHDIEVFEDDHNRALLDAIHEASGARFLVDSSKRNDRLEQILADDTLDVRPIHLVRDPRAQVHGHMKRGETLGEAADRYHQQTREARRLLRGRDHLVVRYEHLARDPREELTRVMRWLGVDFESSQLDWTAHTHHHLAGNRMRFEGDGKIVPDESWRSALNARQRLEIRLRVLGLMPRHRRGSPRTGFEAYRAAHPDAKFSDYYVETVSAKIGQGESHPSLGGNLRSGAFEDAGREPFEFLCREGLQRGDSCVDYGCGSLRIGQHLIRYLDPGKYCGLDVTDRFYIMGKELVGDDTMARRRPEFHVITPETLDRVAAKGADFVLSYDVLQHVPPDELAGFLGSAAKLIGPSTRAYIDARTTDEIAKVGNRSWTYPESHVQSALEALGLDVRIVPRRSEEKTRCRAWFVVTRRGTA